MADLQQYRVLVAALQDRIFTEDYFSETWTNMLDEAGWSVEEVAQRSVSCEALHSVLNRFWFLLPDSGTIRRGPFFQLCHLCTEWDEQIFICREDDNVEALEL